MIKKDVLLLEQINQGSGVKAKKMRLKKKIIKYLYYKGPKSNPELSKYLNTSSPTVQALLNELIGEELVLELGTGNSNGGRRPLLFGINPNSRFVVAIDMGRHATKIGVFNLINQQVSDIKKIPITLSKTDDVTEQIYEYTTEIIKATSIDDKKILAVGIDFPGLVDARKGINYTYFNFEHTTIKETLEKKFNKPVFIENDAKVMALGEYRFGPEKDSNSILSINIDWGVGLGMILNGEIYRGNSGFSGEFGHIPVIKDGPLCDCGKKGCLETIASGKALVKAAKAGIEEGINTHLTRLTNNNPEQLTITNIIDAANQGDEFCIQTLSEIGNHLGKGMAILIHLLNPKTIILGGEVSNAGNYILTPIQQSINMHCIAQISKNTDIVLSDLKGNACILGTLALVMENIFDEHTYYTF